MPSWTIVYLEPVPPEVEAIIRSRLPAGFELRLRRRDETAHSALAEADFAVVATTPLPASALQAGKRLRLIQHQGVGYEKTDVRAAAALGIPVAVCPAGTTIGVAEHTLLLILAVYRRLALADASLRRGEWLQWELRPGSYELAGKTLGVIGFGRIGEAVARRAAAFEVELTACEQSRERRAVGEALGVRFLELDGLLATADIISLHVPLTPETHHLINADSLARVKPTAILVNTARGGLVDEPALVEALRSGRLCGAGLDVFEKEPLAPGHPLCELPNVVITPHISAGTRDALQTKMDACFANLARVARGEAPLDLVAP
jgi:phosphoglycerate dehydrogenase-like enzyme